MIRAAPLQYTDLSHATANYLTVSSPAKPPWMGEVYSHPPTGYLDPSMGPPAFNSDLFQPGFGGH